VIAIQDTGVGIAEQYLSKIFDPYFTTKQRERAGAGNFVFDRRNHGGMIDVGTNQRRSVHDLSSPIAGKAG
jgi:signal transduction histidine kinase